MAKLNKLTEPELIDLYLNQKKSLGDIARLYGNAQNGLFLERKYRRFLEGLEKACGGG